MADETTEFVSPVAFMSQPVVYYRTGTKENGATPWPAMVIRTNNGEIVNRTIDLVTIPGGARCTSVRHINDPKLADGNQRVNGAWDFSDYDLELQKKLHEMRGHAGKIAAAEKRFNEKLKAAGLEDKGE